MTDPTKLLAFGRVMDTEAWLREHLPHGKLTIEHMSHPSRLVLRLVCPCGKKHVTLAGSLQQKGEV